MKKTRSIVANLLSPFQSHRHF